MIKGSRKPGSVHSKETAFVQDRKDAAYVKRPEPTPTGEYKAYQLFPQEFKTSFGPSKKTLAIHLCTVFIKPDGSIARKPEMRLVKGKRMFLYDGVKLEYDMVKGVIDALSKLIGLDSTRDRIAAVVKGEEVAVKDGKQKMIDDYLAKGGVL